MAEYFDWYLMDYVPVMPAAPEYIDEASAAEYVADE